MIVATLVRFTVRVLKAVVQPLASKFSSAAIVDCPELNSSYVNSHTNVFSSTYHKL